MKLPKLILQFYLTLLIPSIYLLVLYLIATYPKTFPNFNFLNSPIFQIINLSISLLGIFIWISSYFYLKNSFGVLPTTKPRITKGIYRYFSHPMYLGIFLTFNGLALTTLSLLGFLVNLFILTPINIFRAKSESQYLT